MRPAWLRRNPALKFSCRQRKESVEKFLVNVLAAIVAGVIVALIICFFNV
jgi:capsular polysaccharide biosynthesis protein